MLRRTGSEVEWAADTRCGYELGILSPRNYCRAGPGIQWGSRTWSGGFTVAGNRGLCPVTVVPGYAQANCGAVDIVTQRVNLLPSIYVTLSATYLFSSGSTAASRFIDSISNRYSSAAATSTTARTPRWRSHGLWTLWSSFCSRSSSPLMTHAPVRPSRRTLLHQTRAP